MFVSMTDNAWWTLFYNCAMIDSTFDACPFCFVFSILVNSVNALVLFAGCVLVVYV